MQPQFHLAGERSYTRSEATIGVRFAIGFEPLNSTRQDCERAAFILSDGETLTLSSSEDPNRSTRSCGAFTPATACNRGTCDQGREAIAPAECYKGFKPQPESTAHLLFLRPAPLHVVRLCCRTLATVLLPTFLLLPQARATAVYYASAGVNPERPCVSSPPASASGAGCSYAARGGSASAGAGALSVGASAIQDGGGLIFPAGASAQASFRYDVVGQPSRSPFPATFRYQLSGYTQVTSDDGATSVAIAQGFVSAGLESVSFHTATQSVNGLPIAALSTGIDDSEVAGIITPTVQVGTDFIALGEAELRYLGVAGLVGDFNQTFRRSFGSARFDPLTAAIISKIFDLGLPAIGIAPGVSANIGFDVEYRYNSTLKVPTTLTTGSFGIGSAGVTATATASPGASAGAHFGSTLELVAVTVPADFQGDIQGWFLDFGNGLTLPITRDEVDNPVPEPSTLLSVFGLVGFLVCHRLRTSRFRMSGSGQAEAELSGVLKAATFRNRLKPVSR